MSKKVCKDDTKAAPVKKREAEFECKTCGALSVKEKKLCKPKKI